MYQEPTYTVENGLYVFYLNGERKFETDVVAIMFDRESGVLLKHGKPENVRAEFDKYKAKLSASEDGALILDVLTVVEGAFDVAELNKVVSTSGYIGVLYRSLTEASQTRH